MHFPIGMGSFDHHAKYQGVFMDLLSNPLFHKGPLNSFKFSLSKGGKEKYILRDGHRDPYQLYQEQNGTKVVGHFFALTTWAK